MDSLFHTKTAEELFSQFHTGSQGLSAEEAKKRFELFGKNTLQEEKLNKILVFLHQFKNIFIYVLIAASLVSIALGAWVDFFVINSIILINSIIGFWHELKAESSIRALKKLTEHRNKVLRDGKLCIKPSSELVPGDVVILHEGDIVTADMRLIESEGLSIDEASLTGESFPVVKDPAKTFPESTPPYEIKNIVFTGTTVLQGRGKGLVVATGLKTYFASIASKAIETSPETPLTKALNFFSKRYVLILVSLFTVLGILGFFQGRSILELAYILVANLVAAVPEGLPIVTTLVMILGAISLGKNKALVRDLPSVETLGSASIIASDKTGTITQGKLAIKELFFTKTLEDLKLAAALCNDTHTGMGDPLDVALSFWVENFEELRNNAPRIKSFPFNAKSMFMGTVNKIQGKETLFVKGAYEILREKVKDLNSLKTLDPIFHSFLEKGLRVLAFGTGTWEGKNSSEWSLEILGLMGFLDPPKEGVIDAVLCAKKAGIHILMITGDHPKTARSIAEEVSIWENNSLLLTGKEIDAMTDEILLEKLPNTSVLARILPEHKYRIVKLLQKSREVVVVTGDGINDVPALRAADLGIAMGNGTEAAKEASKMILIDNNLKTLVGAIQNGRVIVNNIRKVIYYFLSTSFQEIFLIALSLIAKLPLPLSAVQILWINLVTDGVQDKFFPFAKEEGDVMSQKPRRPEKKFLDSSQIFRILFFVFTVGILSFFLYKHLLNTYPFELASTIIFTSVVVIQWANGIQAQKEKEPFFKNIKKSFSINPLIFLGMGLGILLQCFAIYTVPKLFHSSQLTFSEWKYPISFFCLAFLLIELRKWIELFSSWLLKKFKNFSF